MLGGFGGQFSFGHALFFGTGAYVQAIAQLQGRLNAWVALAAGDRRGGAVGAVHRRADLPLRAQGLVLRAGHAGLRRGVPHRRAVGAVHRRRRRPDGAAARVVRQPAVRLAQRLPRGWCWPSSSAALLVTGWLRHSPLRRLAAGGARQRGRGARGRRRTRSASSSARSALGAPSWAPAARSTCRCSSTSTRRIAFGPTTLGRGAGRRHRRRHGHAVGAGARRRGAAPAGRADAQPVRRAARASTW